MHTAATRFSGKLLIEKIPGRGYALFIALLPVLMMYQVPAVGIGVSTGNDHRGLLLCRNGDLPEPFGTSGEILHCEDPSALYSLSSLRDGKKRPETPST